VLLCFSAKIFGAHVGHRFARANGGRASTNSANQHSLSPKGFSSSSISADTPFEAVSRWHRVQTSVLCEVCEPFWRDYYRDEFMIIIIIDLFIIITIVINTIIIIIIIITLMVTMIIIIVKRMVKQVRHLHAIRVIFLP